LRVRPAPIAEHLDRRRARTRNHMSGDRSTVRVPLIACRHSHLQRPLRADQGRARTTDLARQPERVTECRTPVRGARASGLRVEVAGPQLVATAVAGQSSHQSTMKRGPNMAQASPAVGSAQPRSRARQSGHGPPSSPSAVWSAGGARRGGDEAPGCRSSCWCRIEPGAPASPRAWRTSGRSAAAPPGDHAGLPSAGK